MSFKKIKFNRQAKFIVFLSAIFVIALILCFKNFSFISNYLEQLFTIENSEQNPDYKMSVQFLDVGKADCAYIKCGKNSMLIDSGDYEGSENVTEFLKNQNERKLDLVVATHPHRDHIGQMESIIKNFPIKTFMMSDFSEKDALESSTYRAMKKTLIEQKINIKIVKSGDEFSLGDLNIKIFAPCKKYTNMNNNSIVLKIIFGTKSFLFTGDAEKESEKAMLENGFDLKSDVLKVGHHGSNTSTTLAFLNAVSPEYSVISVREGIHHLPSKKTLKRLKKSKTNIFRTDKNGKISIFTNGDNLKIVCEKNQKQ